ncbi:MAG: ribonuclease III [Nitrospirae bacterium]|nr:ribonuclease III [Nitrospirota bacterium]
MIRPPHKSGLHDLEKSLGHVFENSALLAEALTHKSYFHEHSGSVKKYNERLEFLGDSVLGLIVVEYLFRLSQSHSESVLAKMKSYLVSETVLAETAASVSLGKYIMLGKGEEATGGRTKKSILADVLEAVVGAVFLDGGFEITRDLVLRIIGGKIDQAISAGDFYDYKTELQEKTQFLYGKLPEYRLVRQQGMEHKRTFTVSVYLDDKKLGTASGHRKKEAETIAAKKALEKISSEPGD